MRCLCSKKEAYRVANVNEWKVRLARGILPITFVDCPLAGRPSETPFMLYLPF